MNHVTFDAFARRAAGLVDRRSVLGGASGALLTVTSLPFAAEAKKKGKKNRKGCKNRAQACREEFLENCEDQGINDSDGCRKEVNACCKKGATCKVKSVDKLFNCGIEVLCRHGAVIGGFCE